MRRNFLPKFSEWLKENNADSENVMYFIDLLTCTYTISGMLLSNALRFIT